MAEDADITELGTSRVPRETRLVRAYPSAAAWFMPSANDLSENQQLLAACGEGEGKEEYESAQLLALGKVGRWSRSEVTLPQPV